MKVDIYDKNNEMVGNLDLSERIFNVRWNPDLVHQALQAQFTNSREPLAHAKGRGEVRGGGKKPWRQKGTGRARHGSIRSPIWKGGGASFGPTKERNFKKKINKKMRRLAIFSVLSRKLQDGELKIVNDLNLKEAKTKNMISIFKNLLGAKTTSLIIPASANKNIKTALNNIPKINAVSPLSLNVYDLMKYKNIILEKEAVREIEKHYH